MRPKNIPLRSCVICGEKRPKRELIRIVRTPQGSVEIDLTGKKSGRGAYLCHKQSCWQQALKKSRLDYALRGRIAVPEKEGLRSYAASLTGEAGH